MRKFLLLSSLFLLSVGIQAADRSLLQKRQAALQALHGLEASAQTRTPRPTADLKVLSENKVLTVMGSEAGFAIIANDDIFPAVIGYSKDSYNVENNTSLRWFVNAATASMSNYLAEGKKYAPVIPTGTFKTAVSPIVKTVWSQSKPYNNDCPHLSGTTPYPTGCVATALSQIMKHYNYPAKGIGKGTLSVVVNGSSTIISADFGNTTYDWKNMLNDYDAVTYNSVQAKAVSTLMVQCGIAVSMEYTPSGSGAYSNEARHGLIKNFGYNAGINLLYRNYYSTLQWMTIIYKELNAGRPLYYTGSDKTEGGHAFVIDGYNEQGFVHVNWGWGAKGGNGYYDIALLNPQGYSFKEGQDMLVGVSPDKVMDYHSHIISDERFSAMKFGPMLNVNAGTMYNLTGESFTGEVAIVLQNNTTTKVLKKNFVARVANLHSVGELSDMITLPTGLADGTYRLFVGTKSAEYHETEWQLVRRAKGAANSYKIVIAGGALQSIDGGTGDDGWTTTGINVVKVADASAPITVYDLQGHRLLSVPAAQFNADALPVHGVFIVKQGDKSHKIVR